MASSHFMLNTNNNSTVLIVVCLVRFLFLFLSIDITDTNATPTQSPTAVPSSVPTPSPSFSVEVLEVYVGNVCYAAKTYSWDDAFNPPLTGVLYGIRLVHTSGSVSCGASPGRFGCPGFGMFVVLYKALDNRASVAEYYPSPTLERTTDVTITKNLTACGNEPGCSIHWYSLAGHTADSPEITLVNPSYDVTVEDEFALWFTEAFAAHAANDNSGTACVDLYFLYDKANTPTASPTASPTSPSTTPSTTPTAVPTPSPSTYVASDTLDVYAGHVCYDALTWNLDYAFNAPLSGLLYGVRLVHTSGAVSCDGAAYSPFGCDGLKFFAVLYKLEQRTPALIVSEYYPSQTSTDGMTVAANVSACTNAAGCVIWWYVADNGALATDAELVLVNPSYAVSTHDEFVWLYTEAFAPEGEWNNGGVACADAYFLYDKANTPAYESCDEVYDSHSDPSSLVGTHDRFMINGTPIVCAFAQINEAQVFVGTLFESYSRLNGVVAADMHAKHSYFQDYARHEYDAVGYADSDYRWSKARIAGLASNLSSSSSSAWSAPTLLSTCNFDVQMAADSDFVWTEWHSDFDSVATQTNGAYEASANIRGSACAGAVFLAWSPTAHWHMEAANTDTECHPWSATAVADEDDFGHYSSWNSAFSCTETDASTTNSWLGHITTATSHYVVVKASARVLAAGSTQTQSVKMANARGFASDWIDAGVVSRGKDYRVHALLPGPSAIQTVSLDSDGAQAPDPLHIAWFEMCRASLPSFDRSHRCYDASTQTILTPCAARTTTLYPNAYGDLLRRSMVALYNGRLYFVAGVNDTAYHHHEVSTALDYASSQPWALLTLNYTQIGFAVDPHYLHFDAQNTVEVGNKVYGFHPRTNTAADDYNKLVIYNLDGHSFEHSASYDALSTYNSASSNCATYNPATHVLYNMGGWTTQMESYDIGGDVWTALATPTQWRALAGCAMNANSSAVFLFGGSGASGYMDSVEEYSVADDTWTNLSAPTLSEPKRACQCVLLVFGANSTGPQGNIYCVGGFSDYLPAGSKKIEVFNPDTYSMNADKYELDVGRYDIRVIADHSLHCLLIMGKEYGSQYFCPDCGDRTTVDIQTCAFVSAIDTVCANGAGQESAQRRRRRRLMMDSAADEEEEEQEPQQYKEEI